MHQVRHPDRLFVLGSRIRTRPHRRRRGRLGGGRARTGWISAPFITPLVSMDPMGLRSRAHRVCVRRCALLLFPNPPRGSRRRFGVRRAARLEGSVISGGGDAYGIGGLKWLGKHPLS